MLHFTPIKKIRIARRTERLGLDVSFLGTSELESCGDRFLLRTYLRANFTNVKDGRASALRLRLGLRIVGVLYLVLLGLRLRLVVVLLLQLGLRLRLPVGLVQLQRGAAQEARKTQTSQEAGRQECGAAAAAVAARREAPAAAEESCRR